MILAGRCDAIEIPIGRSDLAIEFVRAGLADDHRRHQPHALRLHLGENLIVQMIAVFEPVDPEFEGLPSRLDRAVMRGHLDAVAVRHFDQRRQFGVGHRCRRDAAVRIRDAAGDSDLDPGGTHLDLLARHLGQSGGAVGLHRPVAAGRDDHFAGGLDPWSGDFAAIDRALQREIRAMILARQAHRRDPDLERLARVIGHAEDFLRIGFGDQRIALRARQLQPEMDVHVHQTGDEPLPFHRHDGRAGRNGDRSGRADLKNLVALDDHRRIGDLAAFGDIDHRATDQRRDRCGWRRGLLCKGRCGGNGGRRQEQCQ